MSRSMLALLVAAVLLGGCGGGHAPGDGAQTKQVALGKRVFRQQCVTCHQVSGRGVATVYPTLHATKWTQGDDGRLIRLVLHGMKGPLTIRGKDYNQRMQSFPYLTNEDVAAVLTYVRQDFGNAAPAVSADDVAAVRAATADRKNAWVPDTLWQKTGIPSAKAPPTGAK